MTTADDIDPVRLEVRDAELVVVVAGDLDVEIAHQPAELLHAYFDTPRERDVVVVSVVVDLTAVSFVDSTGLGGLPRAQQETGSQHLPFVLRGVGRRLLRLFQITGLDLQFALE